MKGGESFNPWRGDDKTPGCGFNPADIVCRQRSLTQGQKLLYERLVRFAGRDGQCYPAQETLAVLLGVSARQVRADLKELETARLIGRRKRFDRRSDTYVFTWHEMFNHRGDQGPNEPPSHDLSGSTLPVNTDFERKQPSSQILELPGTRLPGGWKQASGLSGSRLPPNTVQEKAHSSELADGSRAERPPTNQASALCENPFEEFRQRYPEPKRGVKVESACRAYVGRIHGVPGEHEKLTTGLSRYLISAAWQRALADDPSGRFIPTMERFITDGLYLDYPPAAEEVPDEYRRPPGAAVAGQKWDPIVEEFLPAEVVQ